MDLKVRQELNILTDIITKTVPVEQIYLFGSYANGTPKQDSDLDLYVVMKDSAALREIDAMRMIHRAIRDKQNRPVDILVGKQSKYLERRQGLTLEKTVSDEGVVLYG
jgi:predicted nucleotidyltransferase